MLDINAILVILPSCLFLLLSTLIFYRLYLHPLSRIPGPRLAAATGLIEIYFDIILGGQYIFTIEEWHAQYGPIIRISPNQVHILDAEYFDELYTMKQPRHNKPEHLNHRFNTPQAIADFPDSDEHDRRRAIIAPLFSKQRVGGFVESVQSRAVRLCANIEKMEGRTINLNQAWSSYAADNVLWYTLAMSYDFLDYPEFKSPFTEAVSNVIFSLHIVSHFPILSNIMNALPPAWLKKMNPEIGAILDFFDEVKGQVRKVVFGENEGFKKVTHRTVFHELSETLGRGKGALKAMEDDGVSVTMAGIDTTSRALALMTFDLLENEEVKERLLEELESAIPDPDHMPSFAELEKLPYLNAVVQEGLRLSYGISGRMTRYNPHITITYKSYVLPPRTEFSMTPALQHRLSSTFPDPHIFNPNRWLNDPVSPSSGKPLGKYLVQFAKGPRMCLGMHLAHAQIYIGLATLFRRLGSRLKLEEGVTRDVVDMGADYFAPIARDLSGVRVRLS